MRATLNVTAPAGVGSVPVFEWVIALPRRFREEFTAAERVQLGDGFGHSAEFFDEDMIQSAAERLPCGTCSPRTPLRDCELHGVSRVPLCSVTASCLLAGGTRGGASCLVNDFARVGGRVAATLRGQRRVTWPEFSAELLAALRKVDPKDVAEGVGAIFMYTYEIKAPAGEEQADDGSRFTQLYRFLGRAMRTLGDPASNARLQRPQLELWTRVVRLMQPLQRTLDLFLLVLPHQPRVVYRGIDARVADNYNMDSFVLWPAVTSTSVSRDIAWGFLSASDAGTFWTILAQSVADVSSFSWLPEEDEWLLHSLSVHKVMGKINAGLRAMLQINHDMVTVVQVDERGGQQLSAKETVDSRMLAMSAVTRILEPFLATYVPPEVAVGGTRGGVVPGTSTVPLPDAVRDWCRSSSRAAMLVGGSGSGKTSTALWIVRAAADADNPLPTPPGFGERWVPLYVPLPTVRHLLEPGTGVSGSRQPLSDFIAASTHLAGAEIAELQRRPLLLVLDGLEEVPQDLSILQKQPLLPAGGLDLANWELARVIVCIRREMLQQGHGSGWLVNKRLTEYHVLPDATLWNFWGFRESQVATFCEAIVQRELERIAATAIADDAGSPAEVLEEALGELQCAPPRREAAFELQAAARRLYVDGKSQRDIVAEAIVQAGEHSRQDMLSATHAVVGRVRSVDASLVSSPLTLSMTIAVGQELLQADLSTDPRRAVYRAWTTAEVRRRLPRIAYLADECPKFAAMNDDARVELVLNFCGALACSRLMIAVSPSLIYHATLHRFAPISSLSELGDTELSPLGSEWNDAILEGGPLRVEDGEHGLFSFTHASLQDYFASAWVLELQQRPAPQRREASQRVGLALCRYESVRVAMATAGAEGRAVARRLRLSVYRIRILLLLMTGAYLLWGLSTLAYRPGLSGWHHWCRFIYIMGNGVQAWAASRGRTAYVYCTVALSTMAAARVRLILLCESGDVHADDPQGWVCDHNPVSGITDFACVYIPVSFIFINPQFILAASSGANLFEWPSPAYHAATVAAYAILAANTLVRSIMFFSEIDLSAFLRVVWFVIYAFMAYRTQRIQVRRSS